MMRGRAEGQAAKQVGAPRNESGISSGAEVPAGTQRGLGSVWSAAKAELGDNVVGKAEPLVLTSSTCTVLLEG